VALSTSAALREKLGLSTRSKPAPVEQTSLSPAARRMTGRNRSDLLRFMGVNNAAARTVSPSAPAATTVSATKTDSLAIDNDSDLQADPGDTIKYTVNINASGGDATGVTFTDTVDPNTAFVPGSLRATPVAVDDTYSATGNIRITVAAPGVLGNDFVGIPSATITGAPATTANGGDLTVNADGSFTYNPPAGFEGADTFTYTLTNSEGSNSATVTINVSGMIWFINNTASCPCDGRLTNPFNSLSSFQAVNNGAGNNPAANDNIFVYESAIDYVGPVTLLNGQRFIGQDATATLSSITGLTPAPGSDPLPVTNSANATIVNITSASTAITVGSGNLLTGFNGGNAVTDISGTGFGTLTVSDVKLDGLGQALNLSTGTLAAAFISISSTDSATTGMTLTSVAGSMTSGSTTVTNPAGIGVSINTSSCSFSFGNTISTLSGSTGVSLLTNTGTITFGSLNITPDGTQRGLLATDNSMTLTANGGAISTSGAPAVEITRAAGTTPLVISLTSVSANGGANGILLNNTSGSFTVAGDGTNANNGSGGVIQNTTTNGISLTNTQNTSFSAMNIHDIARSGIDGQGVVNFSLAYTTINNVGTAAAGQYEESNIAFNDGGVFTNSNLSGTVSITNSLLTNARRHGIQIEDGAGTISNLTITGNTLTSSTSAAASLGSAILVLQQGSAVTTAHLITGTISNNAINNFPSGEGIAVLGGSGNPANLTSQTFGANGTPIVITNNTVNGGATRLGLNAIRVSFNGQFGVSNFDISCNGNTGAGCSATGPLTNYQGIGISVFFGGTVTGTTTVNKNVLVSNQNLGAGSSGIAVQADDGPAGTGTADPDVNVTINNNSVTANEGFGIRAIARATNRATIDLTIQNNTVAAPTLANRNGIRVDSGSGAGDTNICLSMTGNTSAGSGISQGMGIRKQGTNAAVNIFGIIGLSPSPGTPANAQARLNADNPAGGGTDVLSGSNFVSCAQTLGPVTAFSEDPELSGKTASAVNAMPSEDRAPDVRGTDTLRARHGEAAGDFAQKLSSQELTWMTQQAMQRWKDAGISAEDLMRLQGMTFEIADLPDGQLATATSTHFTIDETAAGYGWYVDLSPADDAEFDVPVPGRELQTTEQSRAFGRIDLLTVVMRELGVAYQQDKKSLPNHLRRLMDNELSTAVRRLPDSRNIGLSSSRSGKNQTGSEQNLASQTGNGSTLPKRSDSRLAALSRKSQSSPIAKGASRQTDRRMNHGARTRMTGASPSTTLADVLVNIGTLPAGESVTITFNVTVNNPFTGALPQVSNQGTVSGTNFSNVLTDDPTVGGTADPTVTPIDLPQVSVAVSPASVAEDGVTNLVYTFTRTGSTTNPMTVNFSVGGSASFTEPDYTQTGAATFTASSGTVVIPSGSSTATVTVDPSVDLTVEPDETVNLTVTSGIGYTVGSPSSASGTIVNDDTSVSIAVSPGSVSEDGATNLVYTFTRTGVISAPLAVNFTVGGTATFGVSPDDYTQTGATLFTPPAGVVTFTAGSPTATVTIDPEADTTVEPDETVVLTLTTGVGYTVGSPSGATGTIVNDDTSISVAVSPGSVAEDGATNLVYTFTRSGDTTGSLTVNFSVGGTATFGVSPNDYTQTGATSFTPPTGTVTFTAGSPTATVTIDPETDSTVEPDETVDLTVTPGAGYSVGSPNSASGTITNDDTEVSVAVSPGSVAEDGATNLVYTFTRTGVTSSSLTVNFSVGGTATFGASPDDYTQTGAASFSTTSGSVTFGAGNSTATVTVNPETDSTVEPDETVDLTVTSGAGYNIGSPSSASGTITNDDTDVSVAVSPSAVAEDGATNLVYTFTRAGVTSSSLTVNFTVGGTASFGASPNDYTQTGATSFTPPTGTVTFGAGSSTATVTINPETDTTIEPDETVSLTLTSGAGYNVSSPSSATGTITNDDADVSVAVSPAAVAEDGATNLVYTFTRTGFTGGALTVNFSVGGTATFGVSPDDYTQTGATTFTTTTGSVTFAPGSPTATVTVDPETDTTAEADETVVITLTAGASYNVVSPNSATGTILNDDTLVSVVVSPSSTAEGGANMVYTFTRTGPTTSALSVNFSVGGSASFPADYSQSGATTFTPPTATVTFGVGSSTATVTVTPLTDCLVEGNETVDFTVQPGAGYGVGSPSSASGTIVNTPDSSAPTITLIPNVNMTLWPPNHQYESVAVTDFVASASDNCDPSVNLNSVYILKITSDEVENGNGDGNTLNDIVIGATCKTAQLRAERDGGGDGRVYTITFKVTDSAGNFTTATATVTVRKNPNTPAVDSGTHYTVNSACP